MMLRVPAISGARAGRLRLLAGLLLLALPLAAAVWAFGNYSARRERSNVDARLVQTLSAASGVYEDVISTAGRRANSLAGEPRVRRAVTRGGRLRVLTWKMSPDGRLQRWRARFLGGAAAVRKVDFTSGGRTVGQVVVFVPLDSALVAWLTERSDLGPDRRLGFAQGNSLVGKQGTVRIQSGALGSSADDIVAGGRGFRAVAEPLGGAPSPGKLMAYERSSVVESKADAARWRVIGVGFGLIAALLALAYFVSPALARSRVSRQERDQADRVLARVGDGIFLVDRDGVTRLWNPAAEAITGLRAKDICSRPAREAIPGWEAIAARVPVASRPGDADDASSPETVPLDLDGRELWISIVGVTLAEGTVYAFRDVTRERRLEELRSEFVATISHELRTPLASLHGAALTLREHGDELSSKTQHELLDMIAVQSRRLADLVEEILITGQLDSGSLRVITEPFDPEELVWTVADVARHRVDDETTIDVTVPAVLPRVAGDAERTRQVLTNLLDNAIKYSPQGGRIELAVEADDSHARFIVRDEGLGIPLSEQKLIFDKFYRLDPDHRRGIGGSGLGLYICRELVRSMNGRIWVESDPGKGSTFTFELPVVQRVASRA